MSDAALSASAASATAPWPPPLLWPTRPLGDDVITVDRLTGADIGRTALACADAQTQRWLPLPSPYTEDDARTFIASRDEVANQGQELTLAFRGRDDGLLAGVVGIGQRGQRYEGSIGYWTTPDRRGRGWTTRAVRIVAAYAFDTMPLRRLEIFIDPDNVASRRVAETAGAVFEGVRRDGMPAPHSGDALLFSLLPRDLGQRGTVGLVPA